MLQYITNNYTAQFACNMAVAKLRLAVSGQDHGSGNIIWTKFFTFFILCSYSLF